MTSSKWAVRNSAYPLCSPWLSVRADDCLTPRGVEVSPYYVLEFPDFVHVLATTGDHVVLVRQYRHGAGIWSLELPGGIMDPGENDPLKVAKRELREETGFSGGDWRYVLPLSVDPARCTNQLHFVQAEGVVQGASDQEPTEDIETVLVSRHEALDLARCGKITNAAHVGMLLLGLS